ncbi:putative equilibrative nucleoside transporter [Arabidopsis thaliana]
MILFGLVDATVRGGMIRDLSLICSELIHVLYILQIRAIATFIELLCMILYPYVFPKLPIVKYYRSKAATEGSKTVLADLAAACTQKQSETITSKFLV